MKKLLVATAIAIMGFALNAATCSWGVWGGLFERGTTDTANGYLVYFFDNNTYSASDAKIALAAGDFSFLSQGYQAEYLSSDGETEVSDVGNFANSYTIDGYMVIFDAGTTDAATYAYVSLDDERSSATTGANGQAAVIDFDDQLGMQTAGNWTATTAVPEPTSGLLLLLGVAGLALKRKRA